MIDSNKLESKFQSGDLKIIGHEIYRIAKQLLGPIKREDLLIELGNICNTTDRRVEYWISGDFFNVKGKFQPDHFRFLVTYFYNERAVSCEDICSFANSLGGDHRAEIIKPWAQDLLFSHDNHIPLPAKSDLRYPKSFSPIETKFLRIIEKSIEQEENKVIVIWGRPGTGKTTLTSLLAQSENLKNIFGNNILLAQLGGLRPQLFYRSLISKINPKFSSNIEWQLGEKLTTNFLTSDISKNKVLLLIDDVSLFEYVHNVMDLNVQNCNGSKIIFTTNQKEIAQNIVSKYNGTMIQIPDFSIEETRTLYQTITKQQATLIDIELIKEIHYLLLGSPLGLHIAFTQCKDKSLERIISLMKSNDTEVPKNILKEVYLPLKVAYERLEERQQNQFVMFSSLPFLRNYNVNFLGLLFDENHVQNPIITSELLEQMNERTGILIQKNQDDQTYEIHSQVLLFAQSLNEKKVDEKFLIGQGLKLNLDKEIIKQIRNLTLAEKIAFTFRIRCVEELKPHYGSFRDLLMYTVKMCFSPQQLTDWELVKKNLPFLTSEQYIFAYRLFRREVKQRYWIISFIISSSIALCVSLIIFFMRLFFHIEIQIIIINLTKIVVFFSIVSGLLYSLVNIDNIFKWNWLFSRIGKEIIKK